MDPIFLIPRDFGFVFVESFFVADLSLFQGATARDFLTVFLGD
jgi:hypothetical protein